MKLILVSALLLLALTCAQAQTGPILQANDTVAITGDSITEQKQYSVFIEDYLLMCQPAKDLRTVQFGWGGERAGGLDARVVSDVLPFKPNVATTCYGMNDGGYAAMTPATGDAYRTALTSAVQKLKAGGVRSIVVGTPGCVDSTAYNRPNAPAAVYNQTLAALGDIAKDIAAKEGVGFADVHTPMMEVMEKSKTAYGDKYIFAGGDGVHPGANGHLVMAYAFLKGLGCDGAIGAITIDVASGKTEGTEGQTIIASQGGKMEIESTRYPFCFQGDPSKPEQTTASVLNFFPFNQELNRYMLVVKGLKGAKAKVTWGKDSKEFPVADLEKGINLAAEFLSNPFVDSFKKVNDAVAAQQAYETTLVKMYLHNLVAFKAMTPAETASLDKVAEAGIAHDAELFAAAKALVTPVRHTIMVESVP